MKQLKILISSDSPEHAHDLAAAFDNMFSYEVLANVPSDKLIFEASVLQPDIVIWKLNNYKKYSSRLKELRFCCPSSELFILSDNPAPMDIAAMFDLAVTACLPAFLSAAQVASAVELSIDAGLICLRDQAPAY